jgi:ferrous-iron efflux pump FieF
MKDGHIIGQRKARLMRLATYAAVFAGVLLVVVKLASWLYTDSVSILSSLADSILDTLASLINLFAVHHALQPADREHRFGHGKAEPLAGLAQSAFIMGTATFLLFEVGSHIFNPRPIEHGIVGIGVMVFCLMVTFSLILFQRHVIRVTGSVAISADSLHYTSDVMLNASVIMAILMSVNLGWNYADPIVGGVIAFYILYSALKIGRHALHILMDHELPDEDRARITEIVLAHPQVRNLHDLRTRSSGLSSFIQLHLEMDGKITLLRAHEIVEQVMTDIRAVFPNAEVLIHEDPEGIEEERAVFSE